MEFLFLLSFIILASCVDDKPELTEQNFVKISSAWFRQAQVDMGSRIKILSPTEGLAVSRGRGNIEGKAYKFSNGKWQPFYSYPYSDFPQIGINKNEIWTINHLVHNGAYKPVLSSFKNDRKEIPLPQVMWDDVDFSMWKSLQMFNDGSAILAGQQGNIISYDGKNWNVVRAPDKRSTRQNFLAGDINDFFMFDKSNGWAVGKDGLILKCANGIWEKTESPVDKHLQKVWMADESTGWIVGFNGTLLKYSGGNWIKESIETGDNLNSIKGVNNNYVLAAGDNSTLFLFDGKNWRQDLSIKNIEDSFADVDVLFHDNNYLIWIISSNGIYTNAKSIGFSFTDFTNQSGIRRAGNAGLFFENSSAEFPDLVVLNEEALPIYYRNNGKGIFSEEPVNSLIQNPLNEVYASSIGDINNDGKADLFLLFYSAKFKMLLGSGTGFIDFSEKSKLNFNEVESHSIISSQLVDLNNDGNLDLYISNYEKQDFYFVNNGAGVFTKRNFDYLKSVKGRSTAAVFADFNNDGLVDIFKSYQTAVEGKPFYLFLNKGNFIFEEKENPEFISGSSSFMTNSVIAADLNNDGSSDLIILNQKIPPILFINNGKGAFNNFSEQAGFNDIIFHPDPLNGIANAADVNNDGLLDLFISSRLFLNSPGLKFTEVSEQTGLSFLGNPSFADVDNDGDMDLFIGSSRRALGKGDRAVLYRNNLNNNNFIKVKLNGDLSSRDGIGTKLFLKGFDKENNQKFIIKKEIGINSSPYVQQNISEMHFGLPSADRYQMQIIFPSGVVKTEDDIVPASLLNITESSFLNHNFILLKNSIIRTFLLLDWKVELIKFSIAILLFLILIYIGIKSKIKTFVVHFGFISFMLLIYVFMVHFSILSDQLFYSILTLGIMFTSGLLLIFSAKVITEKRKQKFISHFKILNLLGEGGMGKVYKAIDIHSKKIVAVKILNTELLKDPENKKRFRSEGQLLSSFNHPNIVKVYESGETDGKGFIAMEYLSGGTLNEYLEINFPLPVAEIKRIMSQVCAGLTEIHNANVVHRDIKTNNLMLDEKNNLRIMDFGLSKSNLVSTMTSLGTVIGTLGYVAPEQITNVFVDHRTDIFSLGVVLYNLASNQLPFKGENEMALIHAIFNTTPQAPSSLNKNINSDYDLLVEKCLRKDINQRYSSVEEVKNDLLNINSVIEFES